MSFVQHRPPRCLSSTSSPPARPEASVRALVAAVRVCSTCREPRARRAGAPSHKFSSSGTSAGSTLATARVLCHHRATRDQLEKPGGVDGGCSPCTRKHRPRRPARARPARARLRLPAPRARAGLWIRPDNLAAERPDRRHSASSPRSTRLSSLSTSTRRPTPAPAILAGRGAAERYRDLAGDRRQRAALADLAPERALAESSSWGRCCALAFDPLLPEPLLPSDRAARWRVMRR